MAVSLVVNEIYLSVQGESRFAGWPCVFVRLTGCPLRCSWCDTAHAFRAGTRRSRAEILAEVAALAERFPEAAEASGAGRLPLVELTGGEPLAQAGALPLMTDLADHGFTVLLETSGTLDIRPVDRRVHRIVDVKCPASGEADRNRWENLADLRPADELKFVLATVEDYEWAGQVLADRLIPAPCPVTFAWAEPLPPELADPALKPFPREHTPLGRRELVERLLADRLPVRFQTQMHKVIWPSSQRGV